MHDTPSLWKRQSFFSLRHSPKTHATPSLLVAVDRNGICIFLLCGTSSKRTLHKVYELLLIKMESACSYSEALPQNARYTNVVLRTIRNTELGLLGVIPSSIIFPSLAIWKNCGLGGMYALLAGAARFSRAPRYFAHFAEYWALYKANPDGQRD